MPRLINQLRQMHFAIVLPGAPPSYRKSAEKKISGRRIAGLPLIFPPRDGADRTAPFINHASERAMRTPRRESFQKAASPLAGKGDAAQEHETKG